jgi:uncharacterized protein (DUF1330 family)
MSAYAIVEVSVHNPTEYEGYKKLSGQSLERFGGRFIVRGGATESLEGDWNPQRIVVIQFPDMDSARAWWHSGEYAEAKKIRNANADSRLIIVDGV